MMQLLYQPLLYCIIPTNIIMLIKYLILLSIGTCYRSKPVPLLAFNRKADCALLCCAFAYVRLEPLQRTRPILRWIRLNYLPKRITGSKVIVHWWLVDGACLLIDGLLMVYYWLTDGSLMKITQTKGFIAVTGSKGCLKLEPWKSWFLFSPGDFSRYLPTCKSVYVRRHYLGFMDHPSRPWAWAWHMT